MTNKIIAHIDMDAFFASVEQRDNPALRGKPVIVGADPKGGTGRGVVSTCSYEARQFGVRSAMPISQAYRLCPQGIYVQGSMRKYSLVSAQMFKILQDFTPDVQPVSVDEAFLDLTGCCHPYGSAFKTIEAMQQRIFRELNLTASIGLAPNKMLAKIASDYCKPNGLKEISEEKILDFLWPLPVERIWGIGPHAKEALNNIGIKIIKDLAHFPSDQLVQCLGVHAMDWQELAWGRDNRVVSVDDSIKSVSHEHTFEQDTSDKVEIESILLELCEKVSRRLRKYQLKGRTCTLKIRLSGFQTFSRSETMLDATNFVDDIYSQSLKLWREFCQSKEEKQAVCVRLIGVRMNQFDDDGQSVLFVEPKVEKKEKIHQAVDRIKNKFGESAIHRGL